MGAARDQAELARLHRRRADLADHIAQLHPHSFRRAVLSAVQAEVTRRTLELELSLGNAQDVPSTADEDQGQELKYFQK